MDAHATPAALAAANAMWDTIQDAAVAHGIDPAMLAAVGIEESRFRNVPQNGGQAVGIWQIDLGQHPEVTAQQASDPVWAANWVANQLASNMNYMGNRFSAFNADQVAQAAAAAYNIGRGGISGNPATIDNGTQPDWNYGATVLALMECWH